jgi:peptide/nickel transport system substrate-binding protein
MPTVASIKAIDLSTVEITTKAPDPLLLKRLSLFAIVPKAYIEKVGDSQFGQKPVGSGPFQLKEYVADDHVTVVPFLQHPTRKPKLTEVTIRNIPDGNARLQGLRTGELDYANNLSFDGGDQLKREGFDVTIQSQSSSASYWIDTWGQDAAVTGPIADKRVRQALNYAVDKAALAKSIWRGLAPVESQLVQSNVFGFNPDLKPYPYDPAKAKQLLADAGYPNGITLTMDYWMSSAESTQQVLYVQGQLKDVGIDIKVNSFTEVATLSEKLYKRQPRADILAFGLRNTPPVDADAVLSWYVSTQKSLGKHYDNPTFDQIYLASAQEMDPAKREKLLQQGLAILHEDAVRLELVETIWVNGTGKGVAGITNRIPDDFKLDTVYRTK